MLKNLLKMPLRSLLVFTVTASTLTAKADFFIFEPGIGQKQENIKLTTLASTESELKLKALVTTLKVGIRSPTGVSLVLAGEYSKGKAEIEPNETEKPEFNHLIAGFQVGVQAMGAMKIYLGYAPHNQLELKDAGAFSGFKFSGNTYQAGLMFYPFKFLGLGAQYNIHQYKEVTGSQFNSGKDVKTYFDKIDSQDLSFLLAIEI